MPLERLQQRVAIGEARAEDKDEVIGRLWGGSCAARGDIAAGRVGNDDRSVSEKLKDLLGFEDEILANLVMARLAQTSLGQR